MILTINHTESYIHAVYIAIIFYFDWRLLGMFFEHVLPEVLGSFLGCLNFMPFEEIFSKWWKHSVPWIVVIILFLLSIANCAFYMLKYKKHFMFGIAVWEKLNKLLGNYIWVFLQISSCCYMLYCSNDAITSRFSMSFHKKWPRYSKFNKHS